MIQNRNLIALIFTVLICQQVFGLKADNALDFNLKQDRYLGEVDNAKQVANYTTLGADLNFQKKGEVYSTGFNPVVQGTFGVSNEFYFGAPELFVQKRDVLVPELTVTFGRKLRTWSHLDEEFNIGIWQSQLRWDYLKPKQEGLVGTFFDYEVSPSFTVTFFTSPVYLPDQGPNFQLKEGHFESANRWFVPPQNRLDFFAREAPLKFQIERESNKKYIMNSSFGLGLAYKEPKSPWWVALNYAYKPLNQIHIGVECGGTKCGDLGGPNPLEVTATIHPMVIKHSVVTLESGFDRLDDQGYLSLTGDFPNRSNMPVDYQESPLDSVVIAGGSYSRFAGTMFGVPSWVKGSYMKVFEVNARTKEGVVDVGAEESSLDRYPYRDVAAIEWKALLKQKLNNKLQLTGRYSYSATENGGWVTSVLGWNMGALTWNLGFDFLGSTTSADSSHAGLFTRYRANDRVYGSVNYVF